MIWYILSITSGLFFAAADTVSKKESQFSSPLTIAWVREAFALPFLLPTLFFTKIPSLDLTFWIAIILCVAMDLLSTYMYMYAIKVAPLSLTVPYLGLTPIFLLFLPRIILGETLSVNGIIGVILVSLGTYILQLDRARYGFLEPFKAIFKNKGSLLMFLVAIIYSITGTLGKLAIQHSNAIIMSTFYFTLLAIFFTPIAIMEAKKKNIKILKRSKSYIMIGIFMAIMAITHFIAISKIQVAYMISLKRFSLLFAILFGWIFFNEKNIKERLIGGIIILTGGLLITLF